jgi:hypothetical protein
VEIAAEQVIVAKPERGAEPQRVAEYDERPPEEEHYEETITLRASDLEALQDTLEDIQF